jgi:MFS family permease
LTRFFDQYRDFLRLPDVTGMVIVAFVSRMPIGMAGLTMLMFLREALGSFSLAGTAVGAYFVAMAAVAPIAGRLIDRYGPTRLLWFTGPVQPVAMLGLYAVVKAGLPFPIVLACAALAGVFQPPITVLTRTLWRHRFDDEPTRKLAFAVDSIMIELNFTLGPALVALILAAASPTAAFFTIVGVIAIAFTVFMQSPMLKYWKHAPDEERHMLGPLTNLRLVMLFCTTFGLTFCFGLLEVGYPGYATALGIAAFGGVLLAVNSMGSAAGGAIYGGMHFNVPLERQFAIALALMSVPLFLHAAVADYRYVFAIVAFVAGMAIAPALTAQTMLVSRLAPAKYATEAFTWSSTFIVTGLGAGMALGGTMIESLGIRATFAIGGATVLTMALLALTLPIGEAGSKALPGTAE